MLIFLLLFLPPAPITKPVICIFPGFLKKTKYNLNLCPRIAIFSLSLSFFFSFVIGYSKPITLFWVYCIMIWYLCILQNDRHNKLLLTKSESEGINLEAFCTEELGTFGWRKMENLKLSVQHKFVATKTEQREVMIRFAF